MTASVLVTAASAGDAHAFFTNEYTQVAPTEERALIAFDGKRETLWVATTFNVNPLVVGNFAWVIPVPTKPDVELVTQDLFTTLDAVTQKKFKKTGIVRKLLYPDIKEETHLPTDVYSRPINIIRFEVFGPDDSVRMLEQWLSEIGYFVPKSADPILREYEAKGWFLVALEVNGLHIQYAATDSLTTTGARTLPVKIAFDTNTMIYPLKFASVQPDMDTEDIPYSFDYGIPSEQILGEKDEAVDHVLSKKSGNKFPRLPLDMTNVKVDISALAEEKVSAPGFATIFADSVNGKDIGVERPDQSYVLTRMYRYQPLSLVEDVTLQRSPDSTRVNPRISTKETMIRASIVAIVAVGGIAISVAWVKRRTRT